MEDEVDEAEYAQRYQTILCRLIDETTLLTSRGPLLYVYWFISGRYVYTVYLCVSTQQLSK